MPKTTDQGNTNRVSSYELDFFDIAYGDAHIVCTAGR